MAFNHFDYVPSGISKSRSIFKFNKAVAGGCEIGYLYPMCAPVRMLPGSTLKLNLAMEIRSGALIAPLQDELILDCFAFNVPNRIVWEHWKQFVGATDDVLFDSLTEYKIPSFQYSGLAYDEGLSKPYVASHLLASWFELPTLEYYAPVADDHVQLRINVLPFRGYNFIWNEFFRPEQLVDPILFSKTDNGWTGNNMSYSENISANIAGTSVNLITPYTGSLSDTPIPGGVVLPTFRVHKSLWTSSLPKPNLETVNLLAGLSAPIGIFPEATETTAYANQPYMAAGTNLVEGQFSGFSVVNATGNPDVVADLSKALLTVNNYRETIMLDNYYQALNRAGSRYDEIIRNIFHTETNFAVIDIPELIVHKRFSIYRKDVISQATTNYGESNVQYLGSQGSYIDTVVKDSFFTKSTTEHSFIHMLFTIRSARIRTANGVEPMWQQLGKFDQYYPQFDGMGDVPRYKRETFLPAQYSAAGELTDILGYQEFGAEYKWQKSSAVNWANPYLYGHIAGLTLTEKLSTQPVLVATYAGGFNSYICCLTEEAAFASCLAISNPMVAPQFILDIRLSGEIVHPMPVYNIPGMGDLL